MISGVRNEHPRVAIAFRDSPERDNFVKFYDMLTTPETEHEITGAMLKIGIARGIRNTTSARLPGSTGRGLLLSGNYHEHP